MKHLHFRSKIKYKIMCIPKYISSIFGMPPQMHHIEMLCKEIDTCHKWIMFCDDDDKYLKERTFKIGEQIVLHEKYIEEKEMDIFLYCLYESTFNKNHREHGHEYWCYCIHKNYWLIFLINSQIKLIL